MGADGPCGEAEYPVAIGLEVDVSLVVVPTLQGFGMLRAVDLCDDFLFVPHDVDVTAAPAAVTTGYLGVRRRQSMGPHDTSDEVEFGQGLGTAFDIGQRCQHGFAVLETRLAPDGCRQVGGPG